MTSQDRAPATSYAELARRLVEDHGELFRAELPRVGARLVDLRVVAASGADETRRRGSPQLKLPLHPAPRMRR
jgi:hypothetical protein